MPVVCVCAVETADAVNRSFCSRRNDFTKVQYYAYLSESPWNEKPLVQVMHSKVENLFKICLPSNAWTTSCPKDCAQLEMN